MELSTDSLLLMSKVKPVINRLGWVVLFITMWFTMKLGLSLLLGFTVVLLIRGLYSVVAMGTLSVYLLHIEKRHSK